ncbi:hypothetical protein BSF_29740 [Bacillus subtilis]|nr:hypothetical protein BSF_29740 [Bacillus subtilis]
MGTIFDKIKDNPYERPKYTRYELAKMVKDYRVEKGLSVESVAKRFDVESTFWSSIEEASRVFNSKIYNVISEFLGVDRRELLQKDKDNLSAISYRSKLKSNGIDESVHLANIIFNEIVMQEKIGAR